MAKEEVTREEPKVNYVSSIENLLLMVEPIASEYVGLLHQQPSLMAVDEQVRSTHSSHPYVRFDLSGKSLLLQSRRVSEPP